MSDCKFTPGPWRWEINEKHKVINLCGGKPKYDMTVMDFVRYGMSGAAPRFIDGSELNLLTRAERFSYVIEGREHHKDWFQGINHPDAHLIAAAPDMYAALLSLSKGEGLQPGSTIEGILAKARGEKQ